jgi:hypothetical protein
MSFLLRLVLPDRPGMLGAVATALGKVEGDIVSVDVVERTPGIAVDDIVVELANGGLPDALISAAQSVKGVWVESIRRYAGALDTQRELELVEAMTSDPDRAIAILVGGLPRIFRAGWCLLLYVAGDTAQVLAASDAAPEMPDATLSGFALLSTPARIVDPEVDSVPESLLALDTELAVSPFAEKETLLLGRPGGPVFRHGEIARLAHLAGIAGTITSGQTRGMRRSRHSPPK